LRRLGALLAWLDQEYIFSVGASDQGLPFFTDAVHLDAYAVMLDESNWRTVACVDGRMFYADLARRLASALHAKPTENHAAQVRALLKLWAT
jgi:hypothetical protein